MRLGGKRNTWKKTALLCLFILVGLCAFVRFFSWGFSALLKSDRSDTYSARAAAFIWKEWYPAYGADLDVPVEEYTASGTGGWLMKFVIRQVPYYGTFREEGNGGYTKELDPAYRAYRENGRILEEYEHLVRGLSESAVFRSGQNPLSPGAADGGGGQGISNPDMTDTALSKTGGDIGIIQNPAGAALLEQSSLAVTGTRYIEEQLADYDFLMKHFYTVHPTAAAGRNMVNAKTFLSEDFSLKKGSGEPQILIYHTHSQEEFVDYAEGNAQATIVGVGAYLTELLRAKGYNVIHDTSVYDLRDGKLDRNNAYTYALDGITGILQNNPSIQVVLDIHRDGVKKGTHLVQQVNGKETATIMFFNGTSQTPTGPIEYLKNQYRTDNLAFSFQMKLCADAYYPGFTRKIYLKGLRYNMHLRPRSALVEVGAQTNTYAEAKNAMEPLSELLDMVLRPREKPQA